MKSYAQDKEDIILSDLLKDVKKGFYIDVGANSPDIYSVTKLFYEQGWCGVNIEPLPDKFNELCAERERDININVAVSNKDGEMRLHLDGMGSTLSETVVKDNRIENAPTIIVEVKTLATILSDVKPKDIHFCKVDVEGFEKQVLEGMDWNYRPWVFCMESTKPNTEIPCYEEWEFILLYAGYKLAYAHGINRYYVDAKKHPELLDKEIVI